MGQGSTPNLPLTGQPVKLAADEYSGGSTPNVVSFGFKEVAPPSDVYIQVTDTMVLIGNTTLGGGDTLTLSIRLLLPFPPSPGQPGDTIDAEIIALGSAGKATPAQVRIATQREYYAEKVGPGYIQVLTAQLPIPTPGASVSLKIPLAEGYLLSAAIQASNATSFGQTYATLYIGRGTPIAGLPPAALLLIADYPTNLIPVGWPPIGIRQTAQGQGTISTLTPANPGAGVELVVTFQTGLRTLVHSLRFTLATSATVATRTVEVAQLDSAGNFLTGTISTLDQTASQTLAYTFALDIGQASDSNAARVTAPLPSVFGIGAAKIQTNIINFQAGDTIQSITLQIETWVA